jgi:hypothetical protein
MYPPYPFVDWREAFRLLEMPASKTNGDIAWARKLYRACGWSDEMLNMLAPEENPTDGIHG